MVRTKSKKRYLRIQVRTTTFFVEQYFVKKLLLFEGLASRRWFHRFPRNFLHIMVSSNPKYDHFLTFFRILVPKTYMSLGDPHNFSVNPRRMAYPRDCVPWWYADTLSMANLSSAVYLQKCTYSLGLKAYLWNTITHNKYIYQHNQNA